MRDFDDFENGDFGAEFADDYQDEFPANAHQLSVPDNDFLSDEPASDRPAPSAQRPSPSVSTTGDTQTAQYPPGSKLPVPASGQPQPPTSPVPRTVAGQSSMGSQPPSRSARSEERRVGKECRSRWSP